MPENKPLLKTLTAFIFLCALITSDNSYAQKAYEYTPGYYLTLNKDTVKADIFFNYWIISGQNQSKRPSNGRSQRAAFYRNSRIWHRNKEN